MHLRFNQQYRWPDTLVEIVRENWIAGVPTPKIAIMVTAHPDAEGRYFSSHAVIGRAHRIPGLPKHPNGNRGRFPVTTIKQMLKTMPPAKVALEVGCSRSSIRRLMKQTVSESQVRTPLPDPATVPASPRKQRTTKAAVPETQKKKRPPRKRTKPVSVTKETAPLEPAAVEGPLEIVEILPPEPEAAPPEVIMEAAVEPALVEDVIAEEVIATPPEPKPTVAAKPTAEVIDFPRASRPKLNPDMLWFDRLSARYEAIVKSPGKDACQYPIGEVRTPGFRFCGDRVWNITDPKFGQSDVYCQEHATLCRMRRAS